MMPYLRKTFYVEKFNQRLINMFIDLHLSKLKSGFENFGTGFYLTTQLILKTGFKVISNTFERVRGILVIQGFSYNTNF